MAAALLVVAAVAAGAAVQSATGFGYALLVAPILAAVVGPEDGVVTLTLIGVPMTAWNLSRWHEHLDRRLALVVSVAGLVGMPLGLWLLDTTDERTLTLLVSGVVLLLTALLWRRVRFPAGRATEIVAGVTSGALATSTGTNGPPLVIAFQAGGLAPEAFRATLAAAFIVEGLAALAGFWARGLIHPQNVRLALLGLLAVPVGGLLGERVFARMDAGRFRSAVLVLLAATGLAVGTRALLA
jgi:hypothetical protein